MSDWTEWHSDPASDYPRTPPIPDMPIEQGARIPLGESFGLPGDSYGYDEVEQIVGFRVKGKRSQREWTVRLREPSKGHFTWEADDDQG